MGWVPLPTLSHLSTSTGTEHPPVPSAPSRAEGHWSSLRLDQLCFQG